MAGRWELGFPEFGNRVSSKEKLVLTTLRTVRAQGHPYVDLRQDRGKLIFFCTLCFARCYGDANLLNHLNGNPHAKKLAAAKETLMKPNPWPFNDGVLFFHIDESEEDNKSLDDSERKRLKLLDSSHEDADGLAIVSYGSNLNGNDVVSGSADIEEHDRCDEVPCDELVIPAVLQRNNITDLIARRVGVGLIGARYSEKDGISSQVCRIWCEWLGNKAISSEYVDVIQEHDFAIVTFSYDYNLGREMVLDDPRYLLPSSPYNEADSDSSTAKKRKAFSDPGDVSFNNQCDSSGEESESSNHSKSQMTLFGNDDQLVLSRVLSSKRERKRIRNQYIVASERSCNICQEKFLPNKGVAALLNRKTGKLACSSRNLTGAFHVFHISCLIHWILLCEVEMHANQTVEPVVEEMPRKRKKGKGRKNAKSPKIQEMKKRTVYCPDCQGGGVNIDKEVLEIPTISLGEIYKLKMKICSGHNEWLQSPEHVENCSVGFTFPLHSDETSQERRAYLKSLSFYRAMN